MCCAINIKNLGLKTLNLIQECFIELDSSSHTNTYFNDYCFQYFNINSDKEIRDLYQQFQSTEDTRKFTFLANHLFTGNFIALVDIKHFQTESIKTNNDNIKKALVDMQHSNLIEAAKMASAKATLRRNLRQIMYQYK